MKQYWKTALAACCAVLLLLPLPAAGAAAVETVRVQLWDGMPYVDKTPIGIYTEDHSYVYPFQYRGSIYIPLFIAGEMLGAQTNWDAVTQTLSIVRNGTPYYRHKYLDKPEDSQRRFYGLEFDAELCSDATVTVDGAPIFFANAAGERLFPIVRDNFVYLPLRSVSELCGKEILYLPEWPVLISGLPTLEQLKQPFLSRGHMSVVHLYDEITEAQLQSMDSYLAAVDTYYAAMKDALVALSDSETLSREEALAHARALDEAARGIHSLPNPELPMYDMAAEAVDRTINLRSHANTLVDRLANSDMPIKKATGAVKNMVINLCHMRNQVEWAHALADAIHQSVEAGPEEMVSP